MGWMERAFLRLVWVGVLGQSTSSFFRKGDGGDLGMVVCWREREIWTLLGELERGSGVGWNGMSGS